MCPFLQIALSLSEKKERRWQMPRQRRKESSTGFYHVIAKGINNELIFNQTREKIYLKKILKEFLSEHNVEIYAYCIMSNHLHLIIKSEIQELSIYMAKCLAKYAEYYNYKHKRNGHVFQNRFKSECIETSKYYWNCLRYIHLNPLKANRVKSITNYKYSSILEYKKRELQLIDKNALETFLKKFEDWEDFMNFHFKKQRDIFIDVSEDLLRQKIDVAMTYILELQQQLEIDRIESLLEEKWLRDKVKEYLTEKMGISIRERDQIVSEIKSKYF